MLKRTVKRKRRKAEEAEENKDSATVVLGIRNAGDAAEEETNKRKTTSGVRRRRSNSTSSNVGVDSPASAAQRSSIYRGVTRHRWTGRYEAHLWDKNCWNESQNKKGRQVYLGAYDDEAAAARAYDLAALKYWGQDTTLNFSISMYDEEFKEMENQSKEEYIGSLRRKSNGFSRGVSRYRGVARHHHNGRWEARIGRVLGNKYLYLGTFATQEEAAVAYDMAAIEHRGIHAVTNFDISRYLKWLSPNHSSSSSNSNSNSNSISNLSAAAPDRIDPHQSDPSDYIVESKHGLINPAGNRRPRKRRLRPNVAGNELTKPPTFVSAGKGTSSDDMFDQEMIRSTTTTENDSGESMAPPDPVRKKRRSFPDDIQTYFNFEQSFADGDDIIFGELSSLPAPFFHYGLDVLE